MVSIIILSYNTKDQITVCLTSLFTHLAGLIKEVIVVDNASNDGSTEVVRKLFPDVLVIKNEKNVGFAAGCNIGAKAAKGEHLLFLNSDTKFTHNSLTGMLELFEKDKNVAVVGGSLLNPDGTHQTSYGNFHTLPAVFALLFFGEQPPIKSVQPDRGKYVDWVTGAFMLVRKHVFEEVRGFDQGYFMYIEDMDLCYKIQKKGYGVYFLPTSILEHKGQGSSNRAFAIIHIYRGILYFYKKHRSQPEYLIVYGMLWVKAIIAIVIGTVTKNAPLVATYREALKF